MARKTDGERIDDLQNMVAKLNALAASYEQRLDQLDSRIEKIEQKLEKGLDKLETRLWWFVGAVFTAIFGLLLTTLFKR